MSFIGRIAALLGISAYFTPPVSSMSLDSESVETIRAQMGGQLQPPPRSQTRWYLDDLEKAEVQADVGDMTMPARLMRVARKDGVFAGVLSTRTDGLVRLPRRYRGNPEMIAALEARNSDARSIFDEMFPPAELALMASDGVLLGVAVGEMLEVPGRAHKVLVRLDPEFLIYRWAENRWYFRSIAGLIAITPGDGRWVLHVPGGRNAPWQHALWKAVGRAYIRKEHAQLLKDNWENVLANPARVAVAPTGAAEEQAESWFKRVMAWGINTVFGMRPGYDVKLLESNGRGFESFNGTIAASNDEMIIAIAGQRVTVDGGAGFQNSDIHKSIRADLIKATADSLAYTINTQGLPIWIVTVWGEAALANGVGVEWDVTPPQDLKSSAEAMKATGDAIAALTEALRPYGQQPDVQLICERMGIPIKALEAAMGSAANDRPSTSLALVRGAA